MRTFPGVSMHNMCYNVQQRGKQPSFVQIIVLKQACVREWCLCCSLYVLCWGLATDAQGALRRLLIALLLLLSAKRS